MYISNRAVVMRLSSTLLIAAWMPLRVLADESGVVPEASRPRHYLIAVDDVVDRISDGTPSGGVPRSAHKAHCVAEILTDYDSDAAPKGTGACTLRAALEFAYSFGSTAALTLALRPGRFVLAARLPPVNGTLQIMGSLGRSGEGDSEGVGSTPGGKLRAADLQYATASSSFVNRGVDANQDVDDGQVTQSRSTPDSADEAGEATGSDGEDGRRNEADDFDPHFTGRLPGQASPIGTIIDGAGAHQLLLLERTAAVHLRTLRLENGRATAAAAPEDEEDGAANGAYEPTSRLGGAVCSLGKLVLHNVAVRRNVAEYGGGLYTEGVLEVHDSWLERNRATWCGGALYAAHGGKANFFGSDLSYNRDDCHRRSFATKDSGATPQYALGSGRAPQAQIGDGHAGAVASGRREGGGRQDVSGAIAEGPPLSSTPIESFHARPELPGTQGDDPRGGRTGSEGPAGSEGLTGHDRMRMHQEALARAREAREAARLAREEARARREAAREAMGARLRGKDEL
jgi:hypothetical protein